MTDNKKPSLADHHWRATLRSRGADQLNADMIAALEQNDEWRFKMLMQVPADWSRNDNILRTAVQHGRMEMFREMVKTDSEWSDKTNLHRLGEDAAIAGDVGFLKFFIEECALDVHYYNEEMLRTAVKNGREDAVRYLLSKDADAAVWSNEPVRDAAENGNLPIVKILLDAGADINAHNYGGSVLSKAVQSGNLALVEFLLDKGADMQANEYSGFIEAARSGAPEMLQLFLDRKIDANAHNGEAFVAALANKNFDTASLLLAHGADINAQNGRALRDAARDNEQETAEYLLQHRANPNVHEYRETPLVHAVRRHHGDMVKLLMKYGADHTVLQSEAWTVARRERNSGMVRAIVEGYRGQLADTRLKKFDEFNRTFPAAYTIDDLRNTKGPSGDTGLLIAAQTGKFADLVGRATSGRLTGEDLFHPDDRIDMVFSHLAQHKALQDFFHPSFWADRVYEVKEVVAMLPEQYQKKIQLGPIANEINYRELRKKAANAGSGLKPPPKLPPKLSP